MNGIYSLARIVVVVALLISCTPRDKLYSEKYWVKTSDADIYSGPNVMSKKLASVKSGDEVFCRAERSLSNVPKGWLEVRYAPKSYGYIERERLADKAMMDELKSLMASVEGKQVQANSIIDKRSRFRIGPSRDAPVIEFLRNAQKADIYGRVVTMREVKGEKKKDVWYKVRLEDGRVGYVYTANLSPTPPAALSRYTEGRTAVSWQSLRTREDKETGRSGEEYITTYRSAGPDIGADFNRVEVYTYDPKSGQYATAFAKNKIKGVLPVNVIDRGGDNKIFQIRQLIDGKGDKLRVQEYSFPSPIRLVREFEEDTTPAPH